MLALQINNQWAVLSEDQSVTIEENSPVWGGGNTFSLPFELDVEANRHILGNSDQLTGMSVYDVLEGQSATLYVMDIPLFYGKLSLEDEVEIENGTVEVSLISSRLAFDDMIEGMNCQDVELTEEIVLGEKWGDYDIEVIVQDPKSSDYTVVDTVHGIMPTHFMRMRRNDVNTTNVSNAYPSAKYCNTRICYPLPEVSEDEERLKSVLEIISKDRVSEFNTKAKEIISGKYVVLDIDRPLSAPCFYVLYFLQCLFSKLSIDVDFSKLYSEEDKFENDICRLAFFNTSCKFEERQTGQKEEYTFTATGVGSLILPIVKYSWNYPTLYWYANIKGAPSGWYNWVRYKTEIVECVATSENFPNVDCSEVVKSLESAFGVRFLFDRKYTKVTPVYVRDVLKDKEVNTVKAEVISVYKSENNTRGFVLEYEGDEQDSSFNYSDWGSVYEIGRSDEYGFNKLQKDVYAFDKTCYLDVRNGNAYRIKNDDDATDLETQNPSLFEVGMFNPVGYGDCSDENRVHKVTIGFTPINMNDTAYAQRLDVLNSGGVRDSITDEKNNEQKFAALLDVDMSYPGHTPLPKVENSVESRLTAADGKVLIKNISYTIRSCYTDIQRYDEKISKTTTDRGRAGRPDERIYRSDKVGYNMPLKYLDNDSPIQTFDAGLTLGIMRGPGNTSGVQDYDEDYDGEGGYKYVSVPTNYAFHSDTVDNYARVFDYDGGGNYTGVDTSKRFSLKLRAEKPTTEGSKKDVPVWPGDYHQITQSYAAGRGLYDKFYTEYAYFVTHRKIAKLTLRMEIADLVNIDWTKRYRIGPFIGFINSRSYTVDSQGISEVKMELYYI